LLSRSVRFYKGATKRQSPLMDIDGFDFADARNRMVDGQIRPNKVTDPRVLSAMRDLPRERFLPPALRARAYVDEDVPLGRGRVLMEPLVIARLIQLLAPAAGERALVVGAGVGYGAALLDRCGARVTALEEDASLAALAKDTLADLAPGVLVIVGPLAAGWPPGAPYDIVLIEGAVQIIPPALGALMRADAGRLATVRVTGGTMGSAVLAELTPLGLRAQPMFDCATPPLPSFLAKPAFTF
jgi:protein-L-isoaspartate(D-aspartate) O-methyltransferase